MVLGSLFLRVFLANFLLLFLREGACDSLQSWNKLQVSVKKEIKMKRVADAGNNHGQRQLVDYEVRTRPKST